MEVFGTVINAVWALLNTEFVIYGYTMTWWQVHLVLFVIGIIFWMIGRLGE